MRAEGSQQDTNLHLRLEDDASYLTLQERDGPSQPLALPCADRLRDLALGGTRGCWLERILP